MKYSEWEEKYKPIQNPFMTHENIMFETYGEELEYIKKADPLKVWTLIDGEGVTGIYSGAHWVNRLCYYVTEVAFNEGEDIEIITRSEEECSCYNEDTCEGDPDCEHCEGSGWKIIFPD